MAFAAQAGLAVVGKAEGFLLNPWMFLPGWFVAQFTLALADWLVNDHFLSFVGMAPAIYITCGNRVLSGQQRQYEQVACHNKCAFI